VNGRTLRVAVLCRSGMIRHTVFVDTKIVDGENRNSGRLRAANKVPERNKRNRLARELARVRPDEEKRMAEEGLVELVD